MLFFSENAGLDGGKKIICGLYTLKRVRDKQGWGWLLEKDDDMSSLLPVVQEVESCQSCFFASFVAKQASMVPAAKNNNCLNMCTSGKKKLFKHGSCLSGF